MHDDNNLKIASWIAARLNGTIQQDFRVQHVLVGYRAAFFGGLFAVVGVYRQTHRAYHEHQAQQCAEHS